MLLQTNSYIVPHDKRTEHAKLLRQFRQRLLQLGCESFEIYEQVGPNWNSSQSSGRFVQIMQFRDRRHQQAVQQAEKADAVAQRLVADFCQLINFPYQQQQGLFATSYYTSLFTPESLKRSANLQPLAEDQATEPAQDAGDLSELADIDDRTNTPDLPIGDASQAITSTDAGAHLEHPDFADDKIQPGDERPAPEALRAVKEELSDDREPAAPANAPENGAPHAIVETLEDRSTHSEHEETLPAGSREDGFDAILDEIDRA